MRAIDGTSSIYLFIYCFKKKTVIFFFIHFHFVRAAGMGVTSLVWDVDTAKRGRRYDTGTAIVR
jgi:hypothetical protein